MARTRRGFTLIELLIFSAIFVVVTMGFITALIMTLRVQSRESTQTDVSSQGQFLVQQIQYYVQSARLVDMAQDIATSTLVLRESSASSSLDPTIITLASGTVYLSRGVSSTPQALTSNKVSVSNLSFTRHYNLNTSSTALGSDSVSYSFTMGTSAANGTQAYSQTFQSSAAVPSPVPKIALIQQTSTINYGTNNAVALAYGTSNESGDLLLAVVTNLGSANATITLADTAGNGWTDIMNSTSSVYNEQFAIFDVQNAINSTNTVTATFGAGVTNPAIFLFEYRGAGISGALDQLALQVQTSTMAISSGVVYPTSTVELAFGVAYLNPLASTITPGAGFGMEASSTADNIFIEDQDLYVTGPVAATWSASQSTNSSAALVTFTTIPANWILVPGNALFGTSNFYAMKYAAVCSNGQGRYLNSPTTTNGTYDYSTSTGVPCISTNGRQIDSLPGGVPIANIGQIQSIAACAAIGTHLLTNAEWHTIAWNVEGVASNWTGGTVGSGNMPEGNWSVGPSLPASSSDSYGVSQGRALTLSNSSVVWDMNDNLWEWVADTIVGSHEPYGSLAGWNWYQFTDPGMTYGVMSQATVGPLNSAWNRAQYIGDLMSENSSTDNTVYAFRRGGFAGGAGCNGGYCGIDTLIIDALPVGGANYIGFRCATGDSGAGGTPTAW